MEGDTRPAPSQRHSSQSNSRTNLRIRNTSHSKNLSKLAKFSTIHGGPKVSMPRNSSKTNLRKNQSETSLQQHKPPPPSSVDNDVGPRKRSSGGQDLPETLQMTAQSGGTRRAVAAGSDPQHNASPAYTPPTHTVDKGKSTQSKPGRSRKRSSKDQTTTGGKKSREEQFDFDKDELFDDDAWEDEHVSVVNDPNAAAQAERQVEELRTLQDREEEEGVVVEQTGQPSSLAEQVPENVNFDKAGKRTSLTALETINTGFSAQTAHRPSVQLDLGPGKDSSSEVLPDDVKPSSSYLQRDIQAALHGGQDIGEVIEKVEPEQKNEAKSRPHIKFSNVKFEINPHQNPEPVDIDPLPKKSDPIAASDSDTSRETVVLASHHGREKAPSALKSMPTSHPSGVGSSPIPKKKPGQKRVHIERPEEPEEGSSPSTGPNTPAIPTDTSTSTPRNISFTSNPQYEFLSKNQRDRASTMIHRHAYPPSAWRDNFLNRATPYVNDVNSEYTQKFARRLDRRIDIRLKNVMQFQDPIASAFVRGQANGVITAFESDDGASDPTDNRSAAGGIGGWFSRLGGGSRRDHPKPSSKERLEAEQLERWERLVDFHDWQQAKNAKRPDIESRPITAETTTTA